MDILSKITGKISWLCLLGLAALTPLLFSTSNSELFEVPKMLFVYLVACLLLTAMVVKQLLEKKILFPANLPTIVLGVFILINIVSAFFSIDKFTSVYGYPTRLNGGLLSLFAYFVIFVGAQLILDKQKAVALLKTILISAFVVALWGIPSHFGKDPTCWVITQNLSSECWQEEFQPTLRIFSTLGQPNWLASHLVLVLPLGLVFLLKSKGVLPRFLFGVASLSLLLAFMFTNSRSGAAGMGLALLVFVLLLGKSVILKNLKLFGLAAAVFLIVSLFFGSSLLIRLKETKTGIAPGGTESGRIRLIVWAGALASFWEKPLLGSGPETFVYAYQKNRPPAHNGTTEWNFYYNKAHNEILNYLSNVGILGTGAYFVFLGTVIYALKGGDIYAKGIISGLVGYQAVILFGFSTVAPQTVMLLMVAAVLGKNLKELRSKLPKFFIIGSCSLALLFGLWLLVNVVRLYMADVYFNRAKQSSSASRSTRGFKNAIRVFPSVNPFYLADFANNTAIFSKNFEGEQISNDYFNLSTDLSKTAYQSASGNFLVLRKIINAYSLMAVDGQVQGEAEIVISRLTELAPTDAQSFLSSAKYYAATANYPKALQNLDKALELKPDYIEAQELKEQIIRVETL